MSKTPEEQAKTLLNSDMGKKLDINKLSQIMNSPAGKAMIKKMNSAEGDKLRGNAGKACEGDACAISGMMAELMSSEEGRALIEQIKGMKK